ncbi:hypothetical protein [Paenibacillus montanisoli]|uniref:Uncharacterized protein n=1 Tax=Paenibacillus montanisoli TaxID=2081970 RepID=A0A328TS49_9BACL|nr:hypothetical protein [Paenibacillus montanisoli]RAP73389.1 hypothetical protein DL346_27155 [Paenibacillus montanisoli]
MKKKPIFTVLSLALAASLTVPAVVGAGASGEVPTTNTEIVKLNSELRTDQEVIHDFEKISEKGFKPARTSKLTTFAAVTPYYVAKTTVTYTSGATSVSDSYTDSSRSTKYNIDLIYAKVKVYEYGGFYGSSEDTQTNFSHAGAQYGSGQALGSDTEAYGLHKFQEAGFQTWEPETYDT